MDFEIREPACKQAQVDAASDCETKRTITVKSGCTADPKIRIGTMEVRLINADFIAMVGDANVLVIRQAHELVIECDARDIGDHFN